MPKNNKKSIKLYSLHIPLLILAGLLVATTVYVSNNVISKDETSVLGKSDKSKGNSNSDDAKNKKSKADNKPLKSQNAQEHKKEVKKVVNNLEEVVVKNKNQKQMQLQLQEQEQAMESEEVVDTTEPVDEIEEVIEDLEEDVDEVAEAIDAVESRPKWQTLLFGSDYKNLGQLRSHLAHNTNAIRKLTRASGEIVTDGSGDQVNTQLGELLEERERITQVIQENESSFSILGWVFRLFNGYEVGQPDDDIDEYIPDPTTDGTGPTTDGTSPSTDGTSPTSDGTSPTSE